MNARNINIDLVKFIGILFLIITHFFFNIGILSMDINSNISYLCTFLYNFSFFQLPIFIIVTGYLMSEKKEYSINYFKKLIKIIISYIVITILVILIDCFVNNKDINLLVTIKDFILGNIGYSWYVLLYIQMYIMMPLINKIYQFLENKFNKNIIIFTIVILLIINLFTYLFIYDIPLRIFNFWQLAYILTGIYIKKENVNIRKNICISIIFIISLLQAFLFIKKCSNGVYNHSYWNQYGSINIYLITSLIFILILNIKSNIIKNNLINRIITNTSKFSLEIYISSRIFDIIIYKFVNYLNIEIKLILFPIVVVLIFLLSYTFGVMYNKIYNYLYNRGC